MLLKVQTHNRLLRGLTIAAIMLFGLIGLLLVSLYMLLR
jgi:hypothetical protein